MLLKIANDNTYVQVGYSNKPGIGSSYFRGRVDVSMGLTNSIPILSLYNDLCLPVLIGNNGHTSVMFNKNDKAVSLNDGVIYVDYKDTSYGDSFIAMPDISCTIPNTQELSVGNVFGYKGHELYVFMRKDLTSALGIDLSGIDEFESQVIVSGKLTGGRNSVFLTYKGITRSLNPNTLNELPSWCDGYLLGLCGTIGTFIPVAISRSITVDKVINELYARTIHTPHATKKIHNSYKFSCQTGVNTDIFDIVKILNSCFVLLYDKRDGNIYNVVLESSTIQEQYAGQSRSYILNLSTR